ncbi:MAG: class I SAM-dependent methyltransferase, partial [Pseudomonadota bacterium]
MLEIRPILRIWDMLGRTSRHGTRLRFRSKEPRIAILCTEKGAQLKARARKLASEIGFPLVEVSDGFDLILAVTASRIELHQIGDRAPGPIAVDFTSGPLARRIKQGYRAQALARAVGISRGIRSVFDATAGLGNDAFLFSSWGCQVVACERSAILNMLFRDGCERARKESADLAAIIKRITPICADSKLVLQDLPDGIERPEVVYLDPMLGEGKKSAKVKKQMQFLRWLFGQAIDEKSLLEIALRVASKRVVVKRPFSVAPITPN